MTTQRAISVLPPPLLAWRETAEIARIECDCEALMCRVQRLRPHSHARLELEMRLRALRSRQLQLEQSLRGDGLHRRGGGR